MGLESIPQMGRKFIEFIGAKYFIPIWDYRKKIMLDKAKVEAEISSMKEMHKSLVKIANAEIEAKLALIQATPQLAIDAAKKDIANGMSFQEAFQKNLPDAVAATHNLYIESLERQHAKQCIAMYALAENVEDSDAQECKGDFNATWDARFWNYAQDMRDEDVQRIWGRLLAGEFKQPGSFSLKTLDVLHSIDTHDVRDFERIAPYVLNSTLVLNAVFKHLNIDFYREATLESVGIFIRQVTQTFNGIFIASNPKYIILGQKSSTQKYAFQCCLLTPAGSELLKLIKVTDSQYEESTQFLMQAIREIYPDIQLTLQPNSLTKKQSA